MSIRGNRPAANSARTAPKEKATGRSIKKKATKLAPVFQWALVDAQNIVLQLGPKISARSGLVTPTRTRVKRYQGWRELAEIVTRVSEWAGGPEQALAWCRSQPISAFGDRTAEALVKSGQADALRDYLDSIALGGFA